MQETQSLNLKLFHCWTLRKRFGLEMLKVGSYGSLSMLSEGPESQS